LSLNSLDRYLDVPAGKSEFVVSSMVLDGRLKAQIDHSLGDGGAVIFRQDETEYFDLKIKAFCEKVNEIDELIGTMC
jgi:hypothetical protein